MEKDYSISGGNVFNWLYRLWRFHSKVKAEIYGLLPALISSITYKTLDYSQRELSKPTQESTPSKASKFAPIFPSGVFTLALMSMTGIVFPSKWPSRSSKEEDGRITITLLICHPQSILLKLEEDWKSLKFKLLNSFRIPSFNVKNKARIRNEDHRTYLQ